MNANGIWPLRISQPPSDGFPSILFIVEIFWASRTIWPIFKWIEEQNIWEYVNLINKHSAIWYPTVSCGWAPTNGTKAQKLAYWEFAPKSKPGISVFRRQQSVGVVFSNLPLYSLSEFGGTHQVKREYRKLLANCGICFLRHPLARHLPIISKAVRWPKVEADLLKGDIFALNSKPKKCASSPGFKSCPLQEHSISS